MRNATLALVILLGLTLLPVTGMSADNALKDSIRDLVGDVVSAGKEIVSGAEEGIEEGRKSRDGSDGAKIISTKEEVEKYLDISILEVKEQIGERIEVVLAVRNANEFPVRIINLNKAGTVVLLDKDGFSYTANNLTNSSEITVLAKAATKAKFSFFGVEGKPETLRLQNKDFKLP